MTYQAQLDRAQLDAAQAPREREISTTQWKSFAGAFGGWMLDGFDLSIFGLVLLPAMTELLPRSGYDINTATIGFFGQLQVAIFLAGWGCSFIWGPIADRLGRVPALTFSILVYAVFTCLAGFSQDIWQLSAFRFLSAVGLGGEWAMAGTLVAETMPERLRPRFGGILHAGCYFGILCGSIINYAVGINLGWRVMFYIGILPALFVLYIRSQTVEPARWVDVSEKTKRTSFSEFLRKILRPPLSARMGASQAGTTRQDQGAITKFIAARGEGLHHVALKTKDINATLSMLDKAGVSVIDRVGRPGSRRGLIGFVHPQSVGGVLVHFVQRD